LHDIVPSDGTRVLDRPAPSVRYPDGVVDRRGSGYTFSMKTAISLPHEVFEQADRLARRLEKILERTAW
jgi:hypothetical protein